MSGEFANWLWPRKLELLDIYLPENLIRALDGYFGLPKGSLVERKKATEARNDLFKAIEARIRGCPKSILSKSEKVRMKDTLQEFIARGNKNLSRIHLQYLQDKDWKKLRIEVCSITYVTAAPVLHHHR